MSDERKRLTYYSKTEITCPVCGTKFRREDLLSGGGRLNAGELTDELHRLYEPTAKFGEVHPLIYPVTVCPNCWFAVMPRDFDDISPAMQEILRGNIEKRKNNLRPLFPDLDFHGPRRLDEGVASCYLAMSCYDIFPREVSPTFSQGLNALRAAWLCGELDTARPGENFDRLARLFYRKAAFFYSQVLRNEQDGTESLSSKFHMGPDVDNNYGYDGVLYLAGLLEFKYGQRKNPATRARDLRQARSTVSRIVGMGKSSKAKPTAILDFARELHKRIKTELEALGADA